MDDIFGNDEFVVVEPAAQVQQPTQEDPAAAFLAQQENEIAGLENEAFGAGTDDAAAEKETNDYSGTNGYAEDFLTDTPAEQEAGDDLFNTPASFSGDMAGTDGLENGVDGFEEMDPSQAYAAIAEADARIQQLRAEPPKIIEWREQHNKMLQEKDEQEEREKEELADQAKKDLEDWEKHRQEQLDKTKENNRIAEKEFLAERDENGPGSEWERVSKLCDFNPKNSKGTKDVSRMRSTLLQLKQHNLIKPMVGK